MDTRKTASAISDVDQLEERFTIDTFPTLQELASYRVVFSIWYKFVEECTRVSGSDSSDPCDIAQYFEDLFVKFLGVPETIEKQLITCMVKVWKEMKNWKCSFSVDRTCFGSKSFHVRRLDPQECFWLPTGKLDYKKTIPKFLSERDLTEVQKFTILCEYCFEDDIKRFALESLPSDFIETVDFYTNRFVYYWVRYLMNELDKIPVDSHYSVDFMMAASCDDKYLLALRYFWDRLSETDQIALAVLKLKPSRWGELGLYAIQEHLLSMMSFKQQRCLLSKIADVIILNFWILESPDAISWAWRHSLDVMTGEQFSGLVIRVFDGKMLPFTDRDKRLSMLIEMWDVAPNRLKNYAVERIEDEIVKKFNVISLKASLPLGMYKFLYEMLLVKDIDGRRNFMLKNSTTLGALIFDPRVMNDIVDLCLPNPDDQLTYKQTILRSKKFKKNLARCLKKSFYDNIDLKIACYTANEQAARQYKKNLLLDCDKLDRVALIFDPANWEAFTEYIDKSFPDSAEALEVKKGFVMTFVRYAGDYWESGDVWSEPFFRWKNDLHYWDDVKSFDEFTTFAEKLFDDDELETLKLTYLSSFQRVITGNGYYWPFYDEDYYRKFVMWCVDCDEQAFVKFKKDNIRAKYIFNGIMYIMGGQYHIPGKDLSSCGYEDFNEKLLTKMDDVLTWYFDGNVEKKSKYKRKRMLNYNKEKGDDIPILERIDEFYNEEDMHAFLKWAFEGDEQAARKFIQDNDFDYDYLHEDSDNHIPVASLVTPVIPVIPTPMSL